MMKRFLRLTRTSTQSGQAIVIVALTMSAMLVLAVLALDGGRFYTQRRTSQNASDIASLGAIHPFRNAGNRFDLSGNVLGKDITDDVVFTQIVQFAQANGIPDTDNNPSNGINENVQAWWLDSSGNQILFAGNPVKIVDAPQFPPPGANGIEVRTRIPYQTFIGGLVHQESLTAQADGTARVVWSNKPITGITDQAVWVGGGADCNNLTDRIAHNYAQTNTAYFGGSTYVNGSLAVGAVQATHFNGDVSVSGPVGIGPADGIPTPYTTFTNLPPYNHSNKDPFETASGSNNFDTGSFHPGASPLGMSPVVQITKTVNPDGTFTNLATPRLLEASDFDPSVPGEMYKRYLYVYQPLGLAPANFFHTIQGDDGITPGYAALQVDNLVNSSQTGIFYVNGDMTVTVPDPGIVPGSHALSGQWNKVTLIVKGKFLSLDNNHTYTTAGPVAQSISVLAGADLGTAANSYAERCASDPATWVFKVDAQHNEFHGTVYAPHGQALFVGNTSGGVSHYSSAVVSYSLHLGISNTNTCTNGGSGCQAQSWSFNFDQSEMGDPVATTTLQQ